MRTIPAFPTAIAMLFVGAWAVLPTSSLAETPEQMMAICRNHAGKEIKMRLPDISTKYEGQRTDGTHAINGTASNDKRTVTFQCTFDKLGKKIVAFIKNKHKAEPASDKPTPGNVEAECLAAVANQVGNRDVSTISVKKGETSIYVLVKVAGAENPWRCDHDGKKVLRVMYMGEG